METLRDKAIKMFQDRPFVLRVEGSTLKDKVSFCSDYLLYMWSKFGQYAH